ncbi:hypothetical protein PVL29_016972 [Vitis rotundifolia]|uniref:Uncharacterized protein n=1 Tax=Vitis rotundifolia TaxID=103349 RepID=A0AA38ZAB1_VITRO|nr:hypothetical protein PVL29_016972 [Vitis rotundifolia]
MSKGPRPFTDVGKKAKDLLTRDYISYHKFTFSTYSNVRVSIVSTTVKKEGLSTEITPSTKAIASSKFPDYDSGKLEVLYFHDRETLITSVALNQSQQLISVESSHGDPFTEEQNELVESAAEALRFDSCLPHID